LLSFGWQMCATTPSFFPLRWILTNFLCLELQSSNCTFCLALF
jgi:hypothetical protein